MTFLPFSRRPPATLNLSFNHQFSALVGVFLLMAASPVWAQMVGPQDPASIAKMLTDRGQTVIVTVDEFDDPFIETSVDNTDYNIFFYGCVDHADCTSISLRAQRMSNGAASFEAMNTWNLDQRWTKIYTDDFNSAVLELDVLFTAGALPAASFAAYLDVWDQSLSQFVRYIDDGDFEYVD